VESRCWVSVVITNEYETIFCPGTYCFTYFSYVTTYICFSLSTFFSILFPKTLPPKSLILFWMCSNKFYHQSSFHLHCSLLEFILCHSKLLVSIRVKCMIHLGGQEEKCCKWDYFLGTIFLHLREWSGYWTSLLFLEYEHQTWVNALQGPQPILTSFFKTICSGKYSAILKYATAPYYSLYLLSKLVM
jgi:hypothetical protein